MLARMGITIRLDDRLHAEARQLAAETGRTRSAVVEDAVREVLARHRQLPAKHRIFRPAHGSGGLQPGVDPADSAALWEEVDS